MLNSLFPFHPGTNPENKVKNSLLVLLHCTFTMFRPRVYPLFHTSNDRLFSCPIIYIVHHAYFIP